MKIYRVIQVRLIIFVLLLGLLPLYSIASEIDSGNKEFSVGNYSEAISHYLKVINNNNAIKTDIIYRIGLCHFMIKNFQKSIDYFKKAKEMNPNIFSDKIFKVPSGGMMPTLLMGDHIIVDNEFYQFSEIKRNDVVIIEHPNNKEKLLIKRIIGLPNEKIEIKENMIFIDNKKLQDKFGVFNKPAVKIDLSSSFIKNFGPVSIPQDKYFVLGDNRNITFDSRHFGLLTKDSIKGKVLIVYFSMDFSKTPPKKRPERTGLILK